MRILRLNIRKDFRQLIYRYGVRHGDTQLIRHLFVVDKSAGLCRIGICRNGIKRAIHLAGLQLVAKKGLNVSALAGQQLIQREKHAVHRHVYHGHCQAGHYQVDFFSAGNHHADLLRVLRNTHVEDFDAYIDSGNCDGVDGFLNGRNIGIFGTKGHGLNHHFIRFLRVGKRNESKNQGEGK